MRLFVRVILPCSLLAYLAWLFLPWFASEAHIVIGCGAQQRPRCLHSMIFDKPFLVLLERADAKTPYFALWVGNPEILVSAGSGEPNR